MMDLVDMETASNMLLWVFMSRAMGEDLCLSVCVWLSNKSEEEPVWYARPSQSCTHSVPKRISQGLRLATLSQKEVVPPDAMLGPAQRQKLNGPGNEIFFNFFLCANITRTQVTRPRHEATSKRCSRPSCVACALIWTHRKIIFIMCVTY
jgi:hypothetical protein